jgi:hypothetical protein
VGKLSFPEEQWKQTWISWKILLWELPRVDHVASVVGWSEGVLSGGFPKDRTDGGQKVGRGQQPLVGFYVWILRSGVASWF